VKRRVSRSKRAKIRPTKLYRTTGNQKGGGAAKIDRSSDIPRINKSGVVVIQPVQILGEGGYGTIYAGTTDIAENGLKGERVAVKVVESNEETIKEIENMTELQGCPHVIQMKMWRGPTQDGDLRPYVIDLQGKRNAIVMDRVEGEDMFSWIDIQSRDERHLNDIGPEIINNILLGVQEMHSRNWVHGDLKVDNVMIGPNNKVTIIDLGFSRFLRAEDYVDCIDIKGTAAYMAPEVVLGYDIAGQTCDCKAVDMYAIGALMYMLVVRKMPFPKRGLLGISAASDTTNKQKIIAEDPSFGGNIDPNAKNMILGLLNKDPLARLNVGSALGHVYLKKYWSDTTLQLLAPLNTVMREAALVGNEEEVKRCLREGADPNSVDERNNDMTALFMAAWKGHIECMAALLEAGADIDALITDGTTALIQAAFFGHASALQWLLDHGANWILTDKEGKTALDYALDRGEDGASEALRAWSRTSAIPGLETGALRKDARSLQPGSGCRCKQTYPLCNITDGWCYNENDERSVMSSCGGQLRSCAASFQEA